MKVKLVDRFVKDNKLTEEGAKLLNLIQKKKLRMRDKTLIAPELADLYLGIHSSLLNLGYVQYNEMQEYPLKKLCEEFVKLGIFEEIKEKKEQEVHTGHGKEATIEALGPLTKKLEKKPEIVAAEEFSTVPTDISTETLEHIDKLLQELSQGTGSLRAAIVEVGDVPKNEKKDILENCRMTRFFAKTVKVEEPPAIEASTIITQCFNFHKTIVGMNRGIREDSSAKKKNPITKAILLTESKDTRITFMLNPEKPKYVFLLETTVNEKIGLGIIFLEMKKTMEKVLKLL